MVVCRKSILGSCRTGQPAAPSSETTGGVVCFDFFLQVIKYLPDHHRVFNAGDNLHGATAFLADIYVEVEHPLEALGIGFRRSLDGGCL